MTVCKQTQNKTNVCSLIPTLQHMYHPQRHFAVVTRPWQFANKHKTNICNLIPTLQHMYHPQRHFAVVTRPWQFANKHKTKQTFVTWSPHFCHETGENKWRKEIQRTTWVIITTRSVSCSLWGHKSCTFALSVHTPVWQYYSEYCITPGCVNSCK